MQNIEMMFQDEKGRMKNIQRLGASYGIDEPVKNEFDIYTGIACNHIASFAVEEDYDRDHHRSRVHSSQVENGSRDNSDSEEEVHVSEAKTRKESKGRDKKRHDRSQDRSRDRDRNRNRSKSNDRRQKSPRRARSEVEANEAIVRQENQNRQGFGQHSRPHQSTFPQGHPTMIPHRLYDNHGQGHLPRVYRQNQGDQVVRIVSDPNKHCKNCNLKGHEYQTCFRYPEPPTNVQCATCQGYHKGECKRFVPLNRANQGQAPQPQRNPNNDRFPVNQGLGNRGRQALPANQAGIQQKNRMQFGNGQNQGEVQIRTVLVHAARSEMTEAGSGYGYGYFVDPSGQVLEEQNLSQITDEEIAQMQEDDGNLIESQLNGSDHEISHHMVDDL